MSEINKIIQKLSPKGVPFKTLNEIGSFVRGSGIQKSELSNSGSPVIHYGEIHTKYGLFASSVYSYLAEPKQNYRQAATNDLIIVTTSEDIAGVGKPLAWIGAESPYVSGETYIYKHNQNGKFLAYLLDSTYFQIAKLPFINGTKVKRIHEKAFKRIQFPIPPIEIQNEIVSILDKFSEQEGGLVSELQAELEARRNQFEFYRENLLSKSYLDQFGVEVSTLGKVGNFVRGKGIQKSDLHSQGMPAIHYGEIHTQYGTSTSTTKSFVLETLWHRSNRAVKGDLVIATTSESVEDVCKATVWFGETEVAVSGDAMFYHHSLDPLFATYFFQSHHFGQHKKRIANGTKVKRISAAKMSNIEIYVPPIAEQVRIGQVLNQLESHYKDARIGLPAEISARHQQYEYYRNKLLTFKELDVA